MKEKKRLIDKAITKSFAIAFILSVGFVAGVPAIIFGATKGMTLLLVVGIIACVMGFYGTPIAWIMFGEKKKALRVVDCVTKEHILSVKEIAMQLQWNEKEVKEIVQKSIVNNYIDGYIFDGDNLTLNQKKAPKRERIQNKCSSCGATLTKTDSGYFCPYCGTTFEEK